MVNCRVCGNRRKTVLFRKSGFDVVKCTNCGLVYSNFNPTSGFLKSYYSKNYFVDGDKKFGYDDYANEEKSSRLTARKRIKSLKLDLTGSVLDVGCAYGFFLTEIPRAWHKYGLEISKFAFDKAVKNNPDAIMENNPLVHGVFLGKKFNLITFWDVIEHLNDPRDTLAIAYDKLSKGGKIAISTGDVSSLLSAIQGHNWHLFSPPQHLSFFSEATIKRLLKSIGFTKITITRPSAYYPISYITHKLANLYRIKLPLPPTIKNITLPVNLGDIMLITASKC